MNELIHGDKNFLKFFNLIVDIIREETSNVVRSTVDVWLSDDVEILENDLIMAVDDGIYKKIEKII